MTDSIHCSLLLSPEDRRQAREIVRILYEQQGYYTAQGATNIQQSLAQSAPTIFGAFIADRLFGTISVVEDGPAGLPMDSIYKAELEPLRRAKRIAEVVQFAVDKERYARAGGRAPLLPAISLFGAVLSYALWRKLDYLCISVNPKHARFYRLLGFHQIGAEKTYGAVSAPAIAYALSIPQWEKQSLVLGVLGSEIRRHMLKPESFSANPVAIGT